MANRFHSDIRHSDIQQTEAKPPHGLPTPVSPAPDKEKKPPFKGAAGPTGSGYPKIYTKVKAHVKSEGI